MLYGGALSDRLALEAAGAQRRLDALVVDCVEHGAWGARAAGGAAAGGGAREVHVEARLLAVGALAPHAVARANLLRC